MVIQAGKHCGQLLSLGWDIRNRMRKSIQFAHQTVLIGFVCVCVEAIGDGSLFGMAPSMKNRVIFELGNQALV